MTIRDVYQQIFVRACCQSEFLLLFLVRLVLAPVMSVAGYSKLGFSNPDLSGISRWLADPAVSSWFGNSDWGLGLPAPVFLASLVGYLEFLGGFALLLGFATRLIALPLMATMIVAIATVHFSQGWFAIAPSDAATNAALFFSWFGVPGAQESLQQSGEVAERLSRIRALLSEQPDSEWLTAKGSVVILNNGAEFAGIYLLMLWQLVVRGGGRYLSVDYWISKRFAQ